MINIQNAKPLDIAAEKANIRRRALLREYKAVPPARRQEILRGPGLANTEGHNFSPKNTVMLMLQASSHKLSSPLSVLGGCAQWKERGRVIQEGAKAMFVCFPKMTTKDKEGRKLETESVAGYLWGEVFDIQQTELVDDSKAKPTAPKPTAPKPTAPKATTTEPTIDPLAAKIKARAAKIGIDPNKVIVATVPTTEPTTPPKTATKPPQAATSRHNPPIFSAACRNFSFCAVSAIFCSYQKKCIFRRKPP